MIGNIRKALVKHLAYKIKAFGKQPRFALFLGAGASRQSGIITAAEMIHFFKERIVDECSTEELRTDEEKDRWLRNQDWHKTADSEYCKLFEQFEPKEIGRQRYIESIIEGREPSFGYVVLANLMANNYINTIITTNFDDLVYSACTSYTSIRPIVYAYGVLASEMRIAAARPKIMKLHGDYLYSALKNTSSETATQDPNMGRQVSQILNEYGLVVVGYNGADNSVMEILSQISEKNDLYWCILRGSEPNESVRNLLEEKGGFIVEIDGFDEMMDEIRGIVGSNFTEMFGSIQARQDQMIEKLKSFAPRYSIDILSEIVQALQNQAKQMAETEQRIKRIQSLSFFTEALKADEAGNLNEAADLYNKAIELDSSDYGSYNNLGSVLARMDRPEDAEAAFRKAIELNPVGHTYNNLVILFRRQGRESEALELAERALQVEPPSFAVLASLAAIHKRSGRLEEFERYIARAREAIKSDDHYNLACLESICGNVESAIEHLTRAVKRKPKYNQLAKHDPDFEWIRDDPRFKDLIS